MSTKAIKAIIDEFADMIGTSQSEMGLAALAEVEAIERAAGEVRVWGIGPVVLPPGKADQHRSEYQADCERRRLEAYDVLARVAAKDAK